MSASFDASEAIFNPDFVFPDPDAPVFDNVEILVKKFEAKPLPPATSAEKGTDMATSAIFFSHCLFEEKWMVCLYAKLLTLFLFSESILFLIIF